MTVSFEKQIVTHVTPPSSVIRNEFHACNAFICFNQLKKKKIIYDWMKSPWKALFWIEQNNG